MTVMRKTDIIHLLAMQAGYKHYLEVCTATTGNFCRAIDKTRFLTCRRLMYNCPSNFDDGLPIDCRRDDFDIGPCLDELRLNREHFDICLIDGYHSYACALRDISEIYSLLADGGALVVHDCLPLSATIASPTWIPGEWCGVSYKAFLDFVVRRDDIDYYTIDTDYGCGVIVKNRRLLARVTRVSQRVHRRLFHAKREQVIAGWLEIGDDFDRAFDYFNAHRVTLLQLLSTEQFLQRVSSESA
jgi:hypothetical protein